MGNCWAMGPQTAWQLFQVLSFMVGDFQGLLQDNAFRFSASSLEHGSPRWGLLVYQVKHEGREARGRARRGGGSNTVHSRLLGCANFSHCICPHPSPLGPGELMISGSCTTGQSGRQGQDLGRRLTLPQDSKETTARRRGSHEKNQNLPCSHPRVPFSILSFSRSILSP